MTLLRHPWFFALVLLVSCSGGDGGEVDGDATLSDDVGGSGQDTGDIGDTGETGDTGGTGNVCSFERSPGNKTLHRLNRAEYNNTVRDLLGDETEPANDFPPDDHGYGYDNNANVLSMSPLLFEKYERATERLLDTALYWSHKAVAVQHFEGEDLQGTVGKASGATYNLWSNGELPADVQIQEGGVYVISARLIGQQAGPELVNAGIRVDAVTTPFWVAAEGSAPAIYQVATHLDPGLHQVAAVFTNDYYKPDENEDRNLTVDWIEVQGPYEADTTLHWFEAEDGKVGKAGPAGFQMIDSPPHLSTKILVEAEGSYRITVRCFGTALDNINPQLAVVIDGQVVGEIEVAATQVVPDTYTMTVPLMPGEHVVEIGIGNPFQSGDKARMLAIDFVSVLGAVELDQAPESASRTAIMICNPEDSSDDDCTRQIVTAFARRAWRRPVTSKEADRLASLAQMAREESQDFETGIRIALSAVMLSPHFIFKVEIDPDLASDQSHPLSNHELATRLSYALWSSVPDQELSDLADAGQLHFPETIGKQVRRMLASPKARSITDNFAGQWLQLRKMDDLVRDSVLFPEFDQELSNAMRRETELLFKSYLHGTQNLLDMIVSGVTFVNPRLAEFYGMSGLTGDGFEPVSTTGIHRFGLLSHASILTFTSHTFGTSPVRRGKWVLSQLLCDEPLPPPPEVVTELVVEEGQEMSMRDRLAAHVKDPGCAVCHKTMDPIGLGMDNYSAIGQWRTLDDFGFPVDPAGVLPGELAFAGPEELSKIIRENPDTARCVVHHLFTYMFGRGEILTDYCDLEELTASWAATGYAFSELFVLLAQSHQFTHRVPDGTEGSGE